MVLFGISAVHVKPISSCPVLLIAITIFVGLSACGRPEPKHSIVKDPSPPELETHLANQVKDALNDNIFLNPHGLEVTVIGENNGFVKLSVAKGNRKLREMLADGADLDSAVPELVIGDSDLRQSWTALKKAVGYVKNIDGVKAVLVTAETNTVPDRADDLYREGLQLVMSDDAGAAAGKMRQAAEMGHERAQHYLGTMHSRGIGVSQDYKEAANWYRRSADHGDKESQRMLGILYHQGWGVGQDYREAVKWVRLAADQSDASSQFLLGSAYYAGQGVEQNYNEASKWYRLSADQGNPDAQHGLGYMYNQGIGIAQDYKEAAKWYRLAADQGNTDAQNRLAWLLATSEDPQCRNAQEAVKYAQMATGKTSTWYTVCTLAAAYARLGDFEKASSIAERALAMLQSNADLSNNEKLVENAKARLASYHNRLPWTATADE